MHLGIFIDNYFAPRCFHAFSFPLTINDHPELQKNNALETQTRACCYYSQIIGTRELTSDSNTHQLHLPPARRSHLSDGRDPRSWILRMGRDVRRAREETDDEAAAHRSTAGCGQTDAPLQQRHSGEMHRTSTPPPHLHHRTQRSISSSIIIMHNIITHFTNST